MPEQIYRLGERVEFYCRTDELWLEGIICEAKLMAGSAWISYGCDADNGFSIGRLEPERVRPISVVTRLGEVASG